MSVSLDRLPAMKEWLTAAEIAAARLRDLPANRTAMLRYAEREGWDSHPAYARPRQGSRGGGLEYHFRLLPSVAQIEWTQRHMVVSLPQAVEPQPDPANSNVALTDRQQRERDARLAIVGAFDRFSRGLSLSFQSRVQIFTDKYALGSIQVDAWIKDLVPSLSKRTLIRWRSLQQAGDTGKLGVDRGLARKGTGVLDAANDGAVRTFILALIVHQPHLSGEAVAEQVEGKFGKLLDVRGKLVPLPPVRAFQRAIAALKVSHRVAITKATNPDLYRSTMAPSGTGTYRWVTEPNTLWMIDASPVDALCTDGRHTMYGCIDIATRRLVITISKTPRASAVALMMRKAILAWGLPQTVKTDNGSDFVANDTKRLMDALGIETDVSRAYSPQEKGHIERAIRTFQHSVGPLLPGFIGHSVADRKAIESRKSFAARLGESDAETFGVSISSAELQRYVDQWLDLKYQHRAHEGLKGKTPFQVAAASPASIRTVDERALDLLLMPVASGNGQRMTTKFGIRIDGYHYQTPSILPDSAVFVRMDPADAGRAYAFAADGAEFLGEALCAELRGLHPATLQRVTRETHAAIINSHLADARSEIKGLAKERLIEVALRVAATNVPNIIALPKREEAHSTPQIEAAIAAMADTPAPSTPLDEIAVFHAHLTTDEGSNVRPLRTTETPHQRFARALDIERRHAVGEAVGDIEIGWLQGYRTGSEYQSMRDIYAESEGSMSL